MARKPLSKAKPGIIVPEDFDPSEWQEAPAQPFIETPIEPAPPVFTNTTANTTIHLGDGRKVAPGGSVEVSPELLRILEA